MRSTWLVVCLVLGCSSPADEGFTGEEDDAATARADADPSSEAGEDFDAEPGSDATNPEAPPDAPPSDSGAPGDSGPPTPGFYVDPSIGKMSNDGSFDRPWSTLEEVFAAGKTFAPGAHIFLRRGYHGGPTVRGKNASTVTIRAAPGHAPIVKWLKLSEATHWAIEDLFIRPDAAPDDGERTMIRFLAGSEGNVLRNVGAYSTQDPHGWRADEKAWLAHQRQGMHIQSGGGNVVDGLHLLNVGNGMLVESTGNRITHSTQENFTRDGWVPLASDNTWEFNVLMNSIMTDHTISIFDKPPKPERLHRDMVQTWNGAKKGMVFRGNVLIAVADPTLPVAGNDPTTTGYVDKRIPAFAGWDGPFTGYTFENNAVFTDHQAGIWLNNATNCTVVNNTLTTITYAPSTGYPSIKIIGSSSGNRVYNNIASKLDFTTSVIAGSGHNLVAPDYAATFLAQKQPFADVHPRATAIAAIGTADDAFAPLLDADGLPRPKIGRDIGAYQHGPSADVSPPTTPGAPRVIVVGGLGADLAWTESTDDRAVRGYDIYRNGVLVGRTRNGARFFDLTPDAAKSTYEIVAFDASGNASKRSPPAKA